MRSIKGRYAAAARPAIPTLTGPEGYFTNGAPALGTPATEVPDWWLNAVQDEMLAPILAAGLTPDVNDSSQLLAAIRKLSGAILQAYLASATCVVPTGRTQALLLCWAGGGGGGGTTGAGSAASGGGCGEFRLGVVTGLAPGASIPVTVGAKGTKGSNSVSPYNGTAGSNSSFGAYLTCIGGGAGIGANGAVNGVGGLGGSGGSGGQMTIGGQSGGGAYTIGSSPAGGLGGGGFMTSVTGPAVGSAGLGGNFPGGGGGGGALGNTGGDGAAGLVLVLFV